MPPAGLGKGMVSLGQVRLSTDEGSFTTRAFVAIRLLLVLNKDERGQISYWYPYLFGLNEVLIWTSTCFYIRFGQILKFFKKAFFISQIDAKIWYQDKS